MKETHLKKLHLRLASDHIQSAKHHAALHKHYGKLAESFGKSEMADTNADAGECLQKIADAHQSKSQHHIDEATFYSNCAKAFHDGTAKAAGMGDSDELMPLDEGLSVVHGDTPVNKIVLRSGMREPERGDVPEEFQKLVEVD
jgi:hypothetical protein